MPSPLILSLAALCACAGSESRRGGGEPSARNIYIGCRQFVAGQATELATWCAAVAGVALTSSDAWCPPPSAGISVEDYGPMISTYLGYYERNAPRLGRTNGRSAFLAALIERWPCPGTAAAGGEVGDTKVCVPAPALFRASRGPSTTLRVVPLPVPGRIRGAGSWVRGGAA